MKKLLGILVLGLLWCNVGFAQKIIIIPVHVHILKVNEIGFRTMTTPEDIKKDFEETNKIWSQANIFWEIKEIDEIEPNIKTLKKYLKWTEKNTLENKSLEEKQKIFDKTTVYLLKISKARDYVLHTKRINIYYVPSIYPFAKRTLSGLSIFPNHRYPNEITWAFVGKIKNVGHSGVLFMSHKVEGSRGRVVAHELGHMLDLPHDGNPGEELMSRLCVLKNYELVCGPNISKAIANKARKYYYKYYKKLL